MRPNTPRAIRRADRARRITAIHRLLTTRSALSQVICDQQAPILARTHTRNSTLSALNRAEHTRQEARALLDMNDERRSSGLPLRHPNANNQRHHRR